MIYVCGDTHIPLDIGKLSMKNFSEQAKMTRNDFVIILGDFGLLWRKDKTFFHWLKWLEEKPFTLLWLDGNHENHEWLRSLPLSEWHGGMVHRIAGNILHLERGSIFSLEEKYFFCYGRGCFCRQNVPCRRFELVERRSPLDDAGVCRIPEHQESSQGREEN